MPVPTNNSRPPLPYQPQQSLPNNTRFDLLQSRPPTAAMLDAEFNALTDDVNMLAKAINEVQAGNIPGAGNPINAHKLLKTDGASNISWTFVTNNELEANAVTTVKINDGAVISAKIGAGAVTALKLANNSVSTHNVLDGSLTAIKLADDAVTTAKIVDGNVTTAKLEVGAVTAEKMAADSVDTTNLIDSAVTEVKIFNGAVTTDKIADATVTAAKVGLLAVDATKISSGNAVADTVLTADGAGKAAFIGNNLGKVLQIVTFEHNKYADGYDANATPTAPQSFTIPFLIKITPKKTASKIIVHYSINCGSGQAQFVTITFCKNDAIFKVGENTDGNHPSVTHDWGPMTIGTTYGCFNFSNLFIDTGVQGTEITYEMKKSGAYTGLNTGYNQGKSSISTITAIELDI